MARKILLADDSVTAQNMGRKILADAGYDVVTVNNGSAALKRITEIKPDLIVLDVYMPGYSGLEVCQRLKDAAETAHIPVLLTVGKLEPFKPEESRRVRADAHIVKPFEASELLTAITRLEDRMVPQQSDGSRFSNSVSGVERFSGDGGGRKTEGDADADTGWKSRLRFPSKKKKEEPEPEPEEVAAEATFRDFRKGKGKNSDNGKTSPAFTVKAPAPPGQEPGLVPDIPRDITPDELDALSALAAKLDGPTPAAVAPLVEEMVGTKAPDIEAPAAVITAPPTIPVEAPAAITEALEEVEPKNEVEAPAVAAHTPPTVEGGAALPVVVQHAAANKIETPVEHVEPPAESAHSASVEAAPPNTPTAVAVDTALLAQEPATVDRSDEPRFATAAGAIDQAVQQNSAVKQEVKQVEAPATTETVAKDGMANATAPTEEVVTKGPEPKLEESHAAESTPEKLQAEQIEQPAAVQAGASVPSAAAEVEESAPSDEELAEALRLLTPATGSADVTTIPSHGTLVAAGQLLAEEAARNAAVSPRWVAEPVALSPEEAAMSLEAEMFRTFATAPAVATATISGNENQRTGITGVSAITAAVENRLAEAEKTSSAVSQVARSATSESIVPAVASEKSGAEQMVPAAKFSEEPAEEVGAATFADAMSRDNNDNDNDKDVVEPAIVETPVERAVESVVELVNERPVAAAMAAIEAGNQDSTSDSGGEDAMGKDKDKKSNWHQIRTTPTSAGASKDAVEAAKEASGADDTPKAMAATAAADGSTSGSATDAGTIASIVDSVMADLRPKIVEEIAKKLAGK